MVRMKSVQRSHSRRPGVLVPALILTALGLFRVPALVLAQDGKDPGKKANPVEVVNAPEKPVPVKEVTGTRDVKVVNLASQPVMVKDADGGTKNVNVVNQPLLVQPVAGAPQEVLVVNTEAQPLVVRGVESAGHEPHQIRLFGNAQAGEYQTSLVDYGVPPGKRFVIEFVSAEIILKEPDQRGFLELLVLGGSSQNLTIHKIPTTSMPGTFVGNGLYYSHIASQSVKIYVTDLLGSSVELRVRARRTYPNITAPWFFEVTLSGYLEDTQPLL